MTATSFSKPLFLIAALYDVLLGLVFAVAWRPVFTLLSIAPPENSAYIHLAAALIVVQGIGFYFVCQNPGRNADIVRMGILFKLAYCGVAAWHQVQHSLPHPIFLLFAVLDLLFLVLFVRQLRTVKPA